ncbi:hypothetical protein DENSPDRAFT_562068 [Dentipellis sp. KUC8613]|nr:hypothetical protein DENSPDRAFT_562068 [Dentipellis sp. KUC8613]
MVKLTSFLSLGTTLGALLTSALAAAPAFDGQYIQANASNNAVEWWWASVIADADGSNPPPTFHILFYQGYAVQFGPRDPSQPEYYIDIKGYYPNGTTIDAVIPAASGDVATSGQDVHGTWGTVGSFHTAADFSTFTVNFTAPDFGLTGSVVFQSNAAHHFGCNTTSGPYFSGAIPKGTKLSTTEDLLWNQLGWATTIPGGEATVDIVYNGSPLKFTGAGYHDANWAPQPLNDIVTTWYFGSGRVGPYEFSYVSATPINSTLVLNTGYISRNGVVLQNQCSVEGKKSRDVSIVTPYGSATDTGLTVPTGYILQYVLADGEKITFNLTAQGENPDLSVYHRWVGTAVGGKEGENIEGLSIFEWLNPGLVPYTPSN